MTVDKSNVREFECNHSKLTLPAVTFHQQQKIANQLCPTIKKSMLSYQLTRSQLKNSVTLATIVCIIGDNLGPKENK